MINDKVRMYLLPPLFNAAVRAGASIMNIYKNLDDYDISLKDDKTPITLADRLAHKTIREYLGRTRIPIKHILQLAQGSVVELEALAGEPMDVLVNGYLIAQGEVVVVNDKFGIRLTDVVTPSERLRRVSRG